MFEVLFSYVCTRLHTVGVSERGSIGMRGMVGCALLLVLYLSNPDLVFRFIQYVFDYFNDVLKHSFDSKPPAVDHGSGTTGSSGRVK